MNKLHFFTLALLLVGATANAGALKNGKWTTSNCGAMPDVPALDDSSVDAYNNTITATNMWQQQATAYLDCMVKEANADNNAIADAANKEQDNYRQTANMLKATLSEAGARLNNR